MLRSKTGQYEVVVEFDPAYGWVKAHITPNKDYSPDELEALVNRGIVRELLREQRAATS